MMSAPQLTPLDDALNTILAAAGTLEETEWLPLDSALNRILAEDVIVPADVPPADNSAVDGYAVRCADLLDDRPLLVSARIPAGTAPEALATGTAARIFTGANVPAGADAVVMQEQARLD
ncbi:MAG: molybdopterin molybdenumtransferase MoeA, partial [Marinobacter sp.]|nr:molybdopterin molybdenumtransferase MoeA [Marinobacter sp.]